MAQKKNPQILINNPVNNGLFGFFANFCIPKINLYERIKDA